MGAVAIPPRRHLTTVPLIARKKRMEKNAPSTLSAMKAARAQEGDNRLICGICGGSTNSLVPERKRVALKIMASAMPL